MTRAAHPRLPVAARLSGLRVVCLMGNKINHHCRNHVFAPLLDMLTQQKMEESSRLVGPAAKATKRPAPSAP
eukprot:7606610-Prorocentrum_lima.AAC.1